MVDRTLRSMMGGLGAVGRPGARPAPRRGVPGEGLTSMQGGPNVGILPSSFMALEGPEVMGSLTSDPLKMLRYRAMEESGLPEVVLEQFLENARMRNQAVDMGDVTSGLYIDPSIVPNLTEGQVREIVREGVSGRMPGELGQLIAQRRREEEEARIGAMPAEADIFALSGPERGTELSGILAQISSGGRPGGRPGGVGRPDVSGGFAPPVRREPKAPAVPEKPPAQLTREPVPFSAEDAFKGAMDAFTEASGQEVQPDKTAEDYMKEFADVTGIDISGKPDKSAALMAFGLALMQNRAGSGFNVGNILRSVGEAGEKALPALQEAQKEARTARLAAGKYALEQVQAAKKERADTLKEQQAFKNALAAEERAFKREIFLKTLELEADAAEAAREGVKFESVAQMEVQPDGGIKVTTGIDKNGNAVYVKPSLEVSGVINGYNRYTKGQELSLELIRTLQAIDQAGPAGFQRIYSDFAGTLSNFGIPMPAYDPEETSNAAKADVLRNAIIVGFKRAITQESQVSDKDVLFMNQGIGEFTATTPIAKVIDAASLFYQYLGGQKQYYTNELEKFSNPRYYAGRNEEFIDVQQQITNGILDPGTYIVNPSEAEAQSSVVGSVDLTAGRP
jgi:hypothetical protein